MAKKIVLVFLVENNYIKIRLMFWFLLTDILLWNGDEPNLLILPKFARSIYFFFSSVLERTEINIVR